MSMGDELRGMVMSFRVSELQMLLGYASQNKTGRKSELQARALTLLKNKSIPHLTQIHAKIRELYKTIQQGAAAAEVNAALMGGGGRGGGVMPPPPTSAPAMPPAPAALQQPPQPPPASSFIPLSSRQNMYGSLYGYQSGAAGSAAAKMGGTGTPVVQPPPPYTPQQAVYPDVRIKRLPFYDILSELIKPSSLTGCLTNNPTGRGHEATFLFYLTPQQATEVSSNREIGPGPKSDYSVQVQLRFCLLETSCEQEDVFPPGISVKVNGRPATLPNPMPTNRPGVEPKRPPRPVNISPLVKLCPFVPNHITVTWTPDYSRGYVLVVHLVRKLSALDLLNRLKTKGVRKSDFTTGLIKEKLCETDSDLEIATTSLRVSLMCPLGKMKMGVPARSTICSHLQCFDASLYLQMNEKRPTWTCPVCDKNIPFDSIVIDGYFQEVLASPILPSDQKEVQLLKDGSWSCSAAVAPSTSEDTKPSSAATAAPTSSSSKTEIQEILDDGEDDVSAVTVLKDESKPVVAPPPPKEKRMIEIDLTCSDSDDDTPRPLPPPSTIVKPPEASVSVARSMESSIISLDSPSPPPNPSPPPPLPPSDLQPPVIPPNANYPPAYPQIIQGAGQNLNRPLVMQIRMPPPADHGRYHPY